MKVYIVRHGEVPHNALKMYNRENEDLTDNGIMQALELRDKIKDIKFDKVISSPLLRTIHTENILTYYDDSIITDDRLIERDCGDLSGQPIEVTNREEYWNYYTDIQYGTSENIQDFFKRVYNFVKEYIKEEYSIYEKIINICDLMCTIKVLTVDKRMMDLLLRHGVFAKTHYHIKETIKLKKYFDDLLGYNLYDLFPEIKENL